MFFIMRTSTIYCLYAFLLSACGSLAAAQDVPDTVQHLVKRIDDNNTHNQQQYRFEITPQTSLYCNTIPPINLPTISSIEQKPQPFWQQPSQRRYMFFGIHAAAFIALVCGLHLSAKLTFNNLYHGSCCLGILGVLTGAGLLLQQ